MNKRQLLEKISASPYNVRFADLVVLIEALGYSLERITGSHHIYRHPELRQPLNLQPDDGKAKPYQVRQVLREVQANQLSLEDEV